MFKEKSLHVLLFCSIVTVCSAVLQYLNPSFIFFDGGLIIAVLLTTFVRKDSYTRIFGAVSILLIIAASFYPHPDMDRQQALLQHLFSLIIVIMTIISVLYVKRLYRSIESDQRQVTALFEHATEGIILTNDKGEIVLLNPAAFRLFEYDREELLGKSIDLLIPQRFHKKHVSYREGFYHHPGNRTMGHGRDLFARKKDGTEFPVEVSLSYYRQKNTLYVIAFIVDITQRKQSEQELVLRQQKLEKITEDMRKLNADLEGKVEERTRILREALKELEQSQKDLHEALDKEKELNEIKSRFVSMASHEFRTPLSTVLSSAALLSRYTRTEEQDKREKHIKKIRDSVKHLNDLLEDFLSLGKLEEGRIKAEPVNFELKEFLDEVTEEMQALTKKGQLIRCNYTGDQTLSTDKRLLRNILINLLSNAAKFSPEGSLIELLVSNTTRTGPLPTANPDSSAATGLFPSANPDSSATAGPLPTANPDSSAAAASDSDGSDRSPLTHSAGANPARQTSAIDPESRGTLSISIQDHGIGISAEDQQHLFSSFYRGSNVLNIEGTGLGLHIVRRYVDLLQGTIRLKSTLGEGTCVTVEIPENIE